MTTPLERMMADEPPTCSDSDMIGIAIIRLSRARDRMQDMCYDDETWRHLEKGAELLGWVATSWRRRQEAEAAARQEPQP